MQLAARFPGYGNRFRRFRRLGNRRKCRFRRLPYGGNLGTGSPVRGPLLPPCFKQRAEHGAEGGAVAGKAHPLRCHRRIQFDEQLLDALKARIER